MRCFVCSDIHMATGSLGRLLTQAGAPLDAILFAGDLTNFGERRDALAALAPFPAKLPIFTIPGNCDNADVIEVLEERTHLVQGRAQSLGDWTIIGFGGGKCGGPGEINFSDEAIHAGLESLLVAAPATHTILLTHQPPFNTKLDQTSRGLNVGSAAIRTLIDRYQPAFHFCGHIHEAWGEEALGKTRCYNVAAVKEGRAAVLDLDSGIFSRLIL